MNRKTLSGLPPWLQDFLGHTKISTTVVYTHVARREARRIISPIGRLFEDGGHGEGE